MFAIYHHAFWVNEVDFAIRKSNFTWTVVERIIKVKVIKGNSFPKFQGKKKYKLKLENKHKEMKKRKSVKNGNV